MAKFRLPHWPNFLRRSVSRSKMAAAADGEPAAESAAARSGKVSQSVRFTFAGLSLAASIGFIYQLLALRRDMRRYPPPGRMLDVGGFRLHLLASGSGRPSILLDSGSGGSSLDWSKIQPVLAKHTRVLNYDRAGHGWSEVARHPHTVSNVTQDLRVLLQVAREPGPLVLVGYSLGGLYAQYFARRYPDQVAGVVLVDATPPEIYDYLPPEFQQRTLQDLRRRYFSATFGLMRLGVLREDPASTSEIDRARSMHALRPGFWQTALKQNRHLGPGLARAFEQAGAFPPVPLVVITPARAAWLAPIHPDLPEQWQAAQARLAELSPNGRLQIVENAKQDLLKDRPELIIEAVKDVLSQVRA